MMAAFTNHLWQSTMFVLAVALVATALRRNGAHIRHRLWFVASMKFLVPFSLLMSLGGSLPRFTPAAPAAMAESVPDLSIAVDQITQPFTGGTFVFSDTTSHVGVSGIAWLLAGVWASGFLAVVGMRVRGWRRVRAALRTSVGVPITAPVPVRAAPGLLEPGVVGFWHPVLLVPEGIERRLTPKQFEAVLLHEWCHVQRRDNLTSAIHMVVEAVFWFHPLVWFVGARLVDERERACDEYVLRTAADPTAYAESILSVCKLYVESPVACVSGVTGSDLKRRIAAIMANRVGLQLNAGRKAALAAVALLALALPILAGRIVSPLRASPFAAQQSSAAGTAPFPKFDVVSVKPCAADTPGQTRSQSGGGGGSQITSPGRLYLQCYPVSTMITEAYLYFADGRAHGLSSVINVPVEGGPDWLKSDRFLIEAKVGQVVPAAVMRGPMLQAILEDRFKLKIRRATREMPVYELVIAKTGAKVAPYTGNECVIRDESVWPPAPLPEGQRYCGDQSRREGDRFVRSGVMKLDELVSLFNLDRPVVNRTGITAPVSYRYELAIEDSAGGGAPRGSWISALRNQLGLDLREAKGPRDFLVIESIERPTPNPPSPSGWPSLAEGPPTQTAASASAQATADKSRFDVVSIKPCVPNRPPAGPAAPAGFRRGGAPHHATVSPGYAYWDCVTFAQLVDQAYADADHPLLNIITNPRQDMGRNQPKRVRGGPSWVETEKFTIEAKAPIVVTHPGQAPSGSRVLPTLSAPMAQALRTVLEDRFKAQVRRATEEQSMWALTIAKGGLNKDLVKDPVKGDCWTMAEYSAAVADGTVPPLDQLNLCGRYYSGLDVGLRFSSFTFGKLAVELSGMFDRYVLDKTGVDAPFNFTIKLDPSDDPATADVRFSRVLERMGLKLEPTKGPAEYLVIERAERPTPNQPSPNASFTRK